MVSIRKVIPTVIVLQIFAIVGVTGWLSFRSGQRSVETLAQKLSDEVSDRIELEVKNYLATPHVFHQVTLATVRYGNLDLEDFKQLKRYFWSQTPISQSWDYIYYGNQRGEVVGVQHGGANEKTLLTIKDPSTGTQRQTYELDNRGEMLGLISQSEYDPRLRPWYKKAVEVGKPTWSDVYLDVFEGVLTVTAVTPVYQNDDRLQGVLAVDISLKQLSDLLGSLEISPAGEAFIIEPSGELVATSAAQPPYTIGENEPQRLLAVNSENPAIQATAKELSERVPDLSAIASKTHFKFSFNGEVQLVSVKPVLSDRGLDWLIVAIVPEADFMQFIYQNTRNTIVLCLAALAVATLLGIIIARWLIAPLVRLSAAAQDIEERKFKPETLADLSQRSDEVGQLANIFQHMASQIYAREQGLKEQLTQLRSETDKAKKAMLLTHLTDSNYFEQLLTKAKRARSKADEYKKLDVGELLKKVSYFKNFSDAEIQRLIDMGYRKIMYPGEYVCREDEPGDAFYIILEGSVDIFVEKIDKFLTKLGAGAFFGELSLLLGIPRTATVKTREDTVLFVLDRDGLQKLLRDYKDLAEQIAQALHEHKAELESRKELLQKMGLLEDEEGFNQNPMGWIRNRMATLFGL